MKNVIVILFTIILAVYIGTTFVLGTGGTTSSTSFKVIADQVGTKANTELTTFTGTTATKAAE